MKPLDPLAISQINRRLKSIRKALPDMKVRQGWIRLMRKSLNMTLKELAERAHVSIPTIAQAERGEAKGKVTVSTLKSMAHAMECEFFYAIVPKASIDGLMRAAALEKARRLLSSADTHMTLEDQRVEQSFEDRARILADQLYKKGEVW